jgi:uncharacterized protein
MADFVAEVGDYLRGWLPRFFEAGPCHPPPFGSGGIISGSGPTDRNGNQPNVQTNTYRMLATALVAAGIRSQCYDKRGIGGSRSLVAREEDVRLDLPSH